MLSQLGCMTLPEEVIEKVYVGQPLADDERELWGRHPELAASLIARIPRLGPVAQMVRFQGGDAPDDAPDDVRFGAHLLQTCSAFEELVRGGCSAAAAASSLKQRGGHRPDVLRALADLDDVRRSSRIARAVRVGELSVGMMLEEDVKNVNGTLIASRGSEVTPSMIRRLVMMGERGVVAQPFRVSIAA